MLILSFSYIYFPFICIYFVKTSLSAICGFTFMIQFDLIILFYVMTTIFLLSKAKQLFINIIQRRNEILLCLSFYNFSSPVFEQIPLSLNSFTIVVVYEFLNHFFQVFFCHFELLVCWRCILPKYLLKCYVLV